MFLATSVILHDQWEQKNSDFAKMDSLTLNWDGDWICAITGYYSATSRIRGL